MSHLVARKDKTVLVSIPLSKLFYFQLIDNYCRPPTNYYPQATTNPISGRDRQRQPQTYLTKASLKAKVLIVIFHPYRFEV